MTIELLEAHAKKWQEFICWNSDIIQPKAEKKDWFIGLMRENQKICEELNEETKSSNISNEIILDEQTAIRVGFDEFIINDGVAPNQILDSGLIKGEQFDTLSYVVINTLKRKD